MTINQKIYEHRCEKNPRCAEHFNPPLIFITRSNPFQFTIRTKLTHKIYPCFRG
ncbi:hypothetical protein HanRHA438_Chr14g0669951 [Helianthus annuus]|nr:hypothetical protein HanRHA438_Chr14g0669951 [Helianthus annuus]